MKTELIPVPDCNGYNYVKKTTGDRTLWGVQYYDNIVVPVKYDKIEREKELSSFIAHKGSKRYIFATSVQKRVCNTIELCGKPYNGYVKLPIRKDLGYEKIFFLELFKKAEYLGYNLYRISETEGKNYFMYWDGVEKTKSTNHYASLIFGPFEDFYATRSGYLFKDNGKWGFRTFKKGPKDLLFSEAELFPPKYDALFEVVYFRSYGVWESYFLCLEAGTWSLMDKAGVPGYIAGYSIPELLNMPISENTKRKALYGGLYYAKTFRVGTQDCGAIYIEPKK